MSGHGPRTDDWSWPASAAGERAARRRSPDACSTAGAHSWRVRYAAKGDRTITTISDDNGVFGFVDLEPGVWTLTIEMRGFATVTRDVTVPPSGPDLAIALTCAPYASHRRSRHEIRVAAASSVGTAQPGQSPATAATAAQAVEILNGSVVNGAATIFAQPRAAGNNRPKGRPLYSGSFTGNFGDSAWNASPYSFGGNAAPIPQYTDWQMAVTVAGPPRIPFTSVWGPLTRVSYQHAVQNAANSRSGLVPTLDERRGDLSSRAGVIRDPLTGAPFPGNVIPSDRIASQATSLLSFYPTPTGATSTGANFERQLLTGSTTDRFQLDVSQSKGRQPDQRLDRVAARRDGFGQPVRLSRQLASIVSGSHRLRTRRLSTRTNLRLNYRLWRRTPSSRRSSPIASTCPAMLASMETLRIRSIGTTHAGLPDFVGLADGLPALDAALARVRRGNPATQGQSQHYVGGDVRLNFIGQLTHSTPAARCRSPARRRVTRSRISVRDSYNQRHRARRSGFVRARWNLRRLRQ